RLGSLELDAIERAPKGEPEIEVQFAIDVDGIKVEAAELKTGSRQGLKLRAPSESDEGTALVEAAREAELEELFFGGTGR
ncbi:MAG TPA: Hsp70 family protein, partial [Spirochaetia bacterium]|nr:Hsp70 family protein [Spirochaetia bacterium]